MMTRAELSQVRPGSAMWRYLFDLQGFVASNLLLLIGLSALLLPTAYRLLTGLWDTPEQGHGPLVLLVVLWLLWRDAGKAQGGEGVPAPVIGWLLLACALPAYMLGRSQDILLLEVGSFIPLLAGWMLLAGGRALLRLYWFALIFMVFLIPLPGAIVDALTGTLKAQVSQIAEVALYAVGYPVARSGVLLTVGQYQLLVADACSGMNSMFSLLAVGSLYVYLTNNSRALHNTLLLLAIIPIAFVANVVRVMILILVTYHYGDGAGQGFVHDFAGLVLFAVALLGMFALDIVLSIFLVKPGDV